MYVFVRFTGIVILVFGLLLMLFGFVGAVYGFVQKDAVVELINNSLMASTGSILQDARLYTSILGLLLFISGMITSALGQLMLVFIDIAVSGQETNVLLRALRERGI